MPKTKEANTHRYVFESEIALMEQALAEEEINITTMDEAAAIAYRHKINRARLYHRSLNEGSSKFDVLSMHVDGNKIKIRVFRDQVITYTTKDGRVGTIAPGGHVVSADVDEGAIARRVRARLAAEGINPDDFEGAGPKVDKQGDAPEEIDFGATD